MGRVPLTIARRYTPRQSPFTISNGGAESIGPWSYAFDACVAPESPRLSRRGTRGAGVCVAHCPCYCHVRRDGRYERAAVTREHREEQWVGQEGVDVDPRFAPAAVNLADLHRATGRDMQGERVL